MKGRAVKERRGLSLVEVLVSAFLLVLVGIVVWALLRSNINASQHGHLEVKVQENTRQAMDTIQGEIRQASRPPRVATAFPQYPSGVLYPSRTDPDTRYDGDYSSGKENSPGVDNQRVLLFEPTALGASNQANIQNYKIVEYRVLPDTQITGEDATGYARIVRRTWDAYDSGNTYNTYIRGLQRGTDFFVDPATDFNSGYDNSGSQVPRTILQLPNLNDSIAMSIYHQESPTGTDRYDVKVFRIRVVVKQYMNAPDTALSTSDKAKYRFKQFELENQVSLP